MTIKEAAEKEFMEAALKFLSESPAMKCCKEEILSGGKLNPALTRFIETGSLLEKIRKEEEEKKSKLVVRYFVLN